MSDTAGDAHRLAKIRFCTARINQHQHHKVLEHDVGPLESTRRHIATRRHAPQSVGIGKPLVCLHDPRPPQMFTADKFERSVSLATKFFGQIKYVDTTQMELNGRLMVYFPALILFESSAL